MHQSKLGRYMILYDTTASTDLATQCIPTIIYLAALLPFQKTIVFTYVPPCHKYWKHFMVSALAVALQRFAGRLRD